MTNGFVRTIANGCVLAVLFASSADAQSATFRAASTYSLPGLNTDATSIMVVTDVGSLAGALDGIPDVVVGAQNQQVAVLYGRADGRLVGGPNTQLGRIPTAIALAEFNGATGIDMLVADTGSNLLCFQGFPDGPPWVRQGDSIIVGDTPVAIATHDFNDDGLMDVAVLHEGNGTIGAVWILYATGSCSFAAPPFPRDATVETGAGSNAIVIGDFDGDGNPDFAVTNGIGNDLSIILGDDEGSYTEVQRISVAAGAAQLVEPVGIKAGRFNGDDIEDLVVVNRNADQIALLIGRADGTFAAPRFFPSGSSGSSPTSIAVGDVDVDGNLDVVVANNRSSDASLLRGDGQGNLAAPRVFMADQEPLAVGVALLDSDDRPDIIVSNRGNQGPTAAVLAGIERDTMRAIENVPTDPSPSDFAIGDVDNDGFADLVAAHGNGLLRLVRSVPSGGFAALSNGEIQVGGDISAVLAEDFDGDLLTDLVVARKDNGMIGLLRGRPGRAFTAEETWAVGSGLSALVAGDWNEDGFTDVAAIRQLGDSPGQVEFLFGGHGGFTVQPGMQVGITPIDIATGDFDNDGHADLMIANNVSQDVAVLLGAGNGTFTLRAEVAVGGAARSLSVADFDGDDCEDFVVALSMNGAVVPYFGRCNGTFDRGPQALSGALSPAGVIAQDFSGDGIPDVAFADEVDNMVHVFIKRAGDRFFLQRSNDRYVVSRRPVRMSSGDFDGDGRYEAAALNSFVAGSISVMSNVTGNGGMRGDANGDGARSAADLIGVLREVADGDGRRADLSGGGYVGGPMADANGDGIISSQDARAVAARLFPRS